MDFQSLKEQLNKLQVENKEMKNMIQQLLTESQRWNQNTGTQTCTLACVSSLKNLVVLVGLHIFS